MKTNALLLNAHLNEAARKRRRGWVYGLVAGGFLLLLPIVGFLGVLGCYTSKTSAPITHVDIIPEEQDAVKARWAQFRQELTEGHPAGSFTLSAKELNGFFSTVPSLNDRLYLSLTGSVARAEISFPLEGLLPIFGKGRYLNAIETLMVRLGPDGIPKPEILSMTVNGRLLPRWVTRRIGQREFSPDMFGPVSDPAFRSQIKSVEISDGTLVLTPVAAQ
jgi:hypothetical protein